MSTPSASGGAGSPAPAGRADRPAPVRPAAPVHPRPGRRGQGAGLQAARRDRGAACRAGPAPTWPPKPSAAAWSTRSRRPRSAAGWPRTRSSPGSTGPGSSPATPTSRPRPPGCWTSTPAAGTANRSAPTTTCISADEKPSSKPAPPPPRRAARPGPAPMRVEFEYRRGGTLAYLAAYDVHHAHVIGHIAPTTGIEPFTALVEQVMTSEPYASRPAGVLGRRQRLLPPRLDRRRPAAATPGRTPSWSTCPCTPPG